MTWVKIANDQRGKSQPHAIARLYRNGILRLNATTMRLLPSRRVCLLYDHRERIALQPAQQDDRPFTVNEQGSVTCNTLIKQSGITYPRTYTAAREGDLLVLTPEE